MSIIIMKASISQLHDIFITEGYTEQLKEV